MWAAWSLCDRVGSEYCTNELAWALAVGIISFVLTLLMMIAMALGYTHEIEQAHPIASILFSLLWTIGVGICTFESPFTTACGYSASWIPASAWSWGSTWAGYSNVSSANGYFACWIAFIASIYYLSESVERVKNMMAAHATNDEVTILNPDPNPDPNSDSNSNHMMRSRIFCSPPSLFWHKHRLTVLRPHATR